jgi:hypothetical protein
VLVTKEKRPKNNLIPTSEAITKRIKIKINRDIKKRTT